MRLIDQNGFSVVPYDLVAISTGYGEPDRKHNVYIHSKLFDEKVVVFAQYSTKEKLLKVMQILRSAYSPKPLIVQECDFTKEVYEKLQKTSILKTFSDSQPSKIEYLNNVYFQFPKDEDVEV